MKIGDLVQFTDDEVTPSTGLITYVPVQSWKPYYVLSCGKERLFFQDMLYKVKSPGGNHANRS